MNLEKIYPKLPKNGLGKLNKLVLEPLNSIDDIVQGGNCQKRAILKNGLDALFINLD